MDDHAFQEIQSAIDQQIDALPDRPSGIKMGFGLAGAFLIRGLLETVVVDMGLWKWDSKAYRGRFVYPDPEMGDFDYIVGKPS